MKGLLIVLGLIALCVIIAHITPGNEGRHQAVTPSYEPSQPSRASVSNAVEEPTLPPDERELLSTISSFGARYREAPNEFQKSTVRRERAQAIARIVPRFSIRGWVGQVASMETTSDGHGILSVKLPGGSSTTVKTWNNSLSDIGSGTLIPQGSGLYEQVSHLAVGEKVIFSGVFAAGNLDYIREASLTEAGAMTEPEFIFTFAAVAEWAESPPVSVDVASIDQAPSQPSAQPVQTAPASPDPAPAAPPTIVPAPAPSGQAAAAASQTSGALHATVESEHGEAVFENLPGGRLKFTFDHDAWQATIHRQPNGTQTLVMRSLKPGTRIQCDLRWEIIQ